MQFSVQFQVLSQFVACRSISMRTLLCRPVFHVKSCKLQTGFHFLSAPLENLLYNCQRCHHQMYTISSCSLDYSVVVQKAQGSNLKGKLGRGCKIKLHLFHYLSLVHRPFQTANSVKSEESLSKNKKYRGLSEYEKNQKNKF